MSIQPTINSVCIQAIKDKIKPIFLVCKHVLGHEMHEKIIAVLLFRSYINYKHTLFLLENFKSVWISTINIFARYNIKRLINIMRPNAKLLEHSSNGICRQFMYMKNYFSINKPFTTWRTWYLRWFCKLNTHDDRLMMRIITEYCKGQL